MKVELTRSYVSFGADYAIQQKGQLPSFDDRKLDRLKLIKDIEYTLSGVSYPYHKFQDRI